MIPMMIIMMRNDFDQKVDDEGRGQETPSRGGLHFIICGQWLTMHARPDVANLAIFQSGMGSAFARIRWIKEKLVMFPREPSHLVSV